MIRQPEPDYIYSGDNLYAHLREMARELPLLMSRHGGEEPSAIITEWRDDGPGEVNGWVTIVKWFATVSLAEVKHDASR